MGLFKQMKDMKATVQAAPGMVEQAQQMAANAQQMAAAQQAAALAQGQAAREQAAAGGPEFEPIAGVSLEQYAEISRSRTNYSVSSSDWQQAVDGWNARMAANPAVARRFNQLYTGR
jgi:hypothetical protein